MAQIHATAGFSAAQFIEHGTGIYNWAYYQSEVSFLHVCPLIDQEFSHNIVKVDVDP